MSKYLNLMLQLFADGGDGGTGAEGTTGVTETAAVSQTRKATNPLANVKYGKQEEAAPPPEEPKQTATPDRNAEFEKLIKGEYKDLYDARMQNAIRGRLKATEDTVNRFNALTPTLELLAEKYGVDANDVEALNKAIEEDESFFQDEALEKGMTVQQLKEFRKMQRENADLKRQMSDQQTKERAEMLYASWVDQGEKTKTVYPSFDLKAEMENPRFVDLLRNNIDVRTAYEVLHKDEIIPAAMQFTAKTVEQKLTNKIIAGGQRPTENGMNSQGAAVVKSDVSQLSKADRQEIIRRVQRGEKIRF